MVFIFLTTLTTLVQQYVPVPFWDQWQMVDTYAHFKAGQWSLWDLFEQHNEHRIFFPRLVFLADYEWTHGSDVLNIGVILLIQCSHAILLWRQVQQLGHLRGAWSIGAAALILGAMVSLAQVQNLGWGFQVQFVGVYAAATAAIIATVHIVPTVTQADPTVRWWWLLTAVFFCIVATFTMANGFLIWPLAVALAIMIRAPRTVWICLAGFGVLMLGAYLFDYEAPRRNHVPLQSLSQIGQSALFLLTYLGNPFQALGVKACAIAGAFSMVCLSGLLGKSVMEDRARLQRPALVLIAIAVFVLLSTALTSFGRSHFGVEYALQGRYVTPAIIYWICVLALLGHSQGRVVFLSQRHLRPLCLFVGGAFLASLSEQQVEIYGARHDKFIRKTLGYTALVAQVDDQEALKGVTFFRGKELQKRVEVLKEYRKSLYAKGVAPIMGKDVHAVYEEAEREACEGNIEKIVAVGSRPGGRRVAGWAWDRENMSAPENIILVNRRGEIRGIARAGFKRDDVGDDLHEAGSGYAGWVGHVARTGRRIRAYAVLSDGRRICLVDTAQINVD